MLKLLLLDVLTISFFCSSECKITKHALSAKDNWRRLESVVVSLRRWSQYLLRMVVRAAYITVFTRMHLLHFIQQAHLQWTNHFLYIELLVLLFISNIKQKIIFFSWRIIYIHIYMRFMVTGFTDHPVVWCFQLLKLHYRKILCFFIYCNGEHAWKLCGFTCRTRWWERV